MIKFRPDFSIHSYQRLSLRSLKVIILGIVFCIVIILVVLCQPAYLRLVSLQEEEIYWQNVLQKESAKNLPAIPTMDQLPDMIELCRTKFLDEGVAVSSLNVERFGERREPGKGAAIDYALVRLRFLGQWGGIVSTLQVLEEMGDVSIHIQEVLLTEAGGEALVQIFYSTGY